MGGTSALRMTMRGLFFTLVLCAIIMLSSADSNAQGEGFDVVDSVAWDKYLAATETDPDAEEPDLYDADEQLSAPESPESTMFFEQNQKSQAHVQDSEASQFFEGNDDDDKTDPVHDPEQNLQQWDQFDS